MARARFPGRPPRAFQRRRVRVLEPAARRSPRPSPPPARPRSPEAPPPQTAPPEEAERQKLRESDVDGETNVEIGAEKSSNADSPPREEDAEATRPAKTRSQQKMQVTGDDSEKCVPVPMPVKKTVTFGTVESCGDTFKPIKRPPSKCNRPLVSIIKKKSAFKSSDHAFHNIVKPAKLTDLGTKTCLDFGSLRAHHNRSPPVKKSTLKFSQNEDESSLSQCSNSSSLVISSDKDCGKKFVLPSHSAHSSRTIKPNKRFIDVDDGLVSPNPSQGTKVLKKPKLILNQNDNNVCHDEAYETCDSSANSNDSSDSKSVENHLNQGKPTSYFDKSINLFGSAPNKGLSATFQDTFVNGLKSAHSVKISSQEDSETSKNDASETSEQVSNEQLGGVISRRLLQPSRHISETPCTSDQSSSSTASESSESEDDSPGTSESEESDLDEKTPMEKVQTQSQLVSGKVVLREARLQLNVNNNGASNNNGADGPFSSFGNQCNTIANPPGTVTCGVCGAVRFYKFVRQARKFGIYSCESCRKFISKMLKRLNIAQSSTTPQLQCLSGEGNCRVPPIVRSQQWKLLRCAYKARCHACWLKMCIKAFQVPAALKASLQTMLPPYMRPTSPKSNVALPTTNPINSVLSNATVFNSLSNEEQDNNNSSIHKNIKSGILKKCPEDKQEVNNKIELDKSKPKENHEIDTSTNISRKRRHTRIKVRKKDNLDIKQQFDSTKRQKVELKGPRVKHVCRSASIVLGQAIATFPLNDDKSVSDDCDDRLICDNAKPSTETKDNSNDISKFINCDCGDGIHTCEMDNITDDETNAVIDESNVPKDDDDSNDSYDSAVLKDMNKENHPNSSVSQENDTEKDEITDKNDELSSDVIPFKKQPKPFLGNFSNIRVSSKLKYSQRKSELICTDFWESYDPDEVCNTGWGLISSIPFTVTGVCFLCGSRGKEKLIHCTECCEMYHPFCVEMSGETGRLWLCPRCVQCTGCGQSGNSPASSLCRVCHRHFHYECLISNRTPKYRSDWPQICNSCLKCKSCDSFKVTKFLGNLPFCTSCFKLRQKGNYCPLCQGCYQDNDFDSKMMECGWCSRWVHASCEGLSGEGYQLVSALPHSVEYICKQCMPENAQWRNMLGTYLRVKLLNILKCLAKNKNACAILKLTPHKKTPIVKKPCICSSPYAVRKLFFEGKSITDSIDCEKKSTDKPSSEKNIDLCPNYDVLTTSDSEAGKAKGIVHKLQESLLQNQEICISVDSCSANVDKIDKLKEKYRIKECCVKMRSFSQNEDLAEYYDSDDSSSTVSSLDFAEDNNKFNSKYKLKKANSEHKCKCVFTNKNRSEQNESCQCLVTNSDLSPSLIDIKSKVNCNEYSSVKDFNKDMQDAISRTSSPEVRKIYKDIFTENFPWFDCELNCLNPSLEIKDDNDDESLKDEELSNYLMNRNYEKGTQKMIVDEDQTVPSTDSDYKSLINCAYDDTSLYDSRTCVLCKTVGEGIPSMEERLLYCGQGDWIHANCALWSAEVFEEIDGSLQNVQSAIARGKMIKCSKCSSKGASVGCCAKNCSETYHFTCARSIGCALLDDKRVFCPSHLDDAKDRIIQNDNDFVLSRPVYVELDKKKKKYSDPQNVQFILGSLTVNNVGKIIPSVSDFEDILIPADFSCARLYWSCKQPWKIVKYTIRTKLLITEPTPAFDLGVNITLDHSTNPNTVERILAEISSWHKSLDSSSHSLMSSKKDKSPIKFGNNTNVTLEDYAVKQVMEYMLDIICKQDTTDDSPEEEPQNTADLLPPELKDAIFEDLNHDLLDGISMQDIFPKLMSYEDLIAMDMKNELGSINDVREVKGSENTEENILKLSEDIPHHLHEKLKKGFYLSNVNSEQSTEGRISSQDILDEIINGQNDSFKDLKRSKSEIMLHGANLKNFAANRNQRSCSLTWSCKLDNATIKRCKLPKSGLLPRSDSSGNIIMRVDGSSDLIDSISTRPKTEDVSTDAKTQWQTKSIKDKTDDLSERLFNKTNETSESSITELCSNKDKSNSSEQVIDFYTKIHCSPISQLDGMDDISDCSSDINSPGSSPVYNTEYEPIPQLDGADEVSSSSCSESGSPPREQNTGIFFRPNDMNNAYTMTISAAGLNVTPVNEMLIRSSLDDNILRTGNIEQTVKCDRCHCTYRTKDSFNRHLPTCDMMSTSESEGETPKSPESRTLTTLQNAFSAPFNAPTYINQQNQIFESTEQFNIAKPAIVGTRRTSVNTRQITINGTIVETQSPEPPNSLKTIGHESVSNLQEIPNSFAIKSSFLQESPKITLGQGILSQPQIMVTNLPLSPPRNQTPNGSKCGINQNQGNLPYSICVKPNTGLHTLQPSNSTITHMIPSSGNIQTVFSSNPNQVLTLSSPQQNIIQNIQTKTPIMQTFTGVPNNQTLTVPMNSIQAISSNGNNSFVRPSLPMQNTPTILMPTTGIPRMSSPNLHQKNQILLPHVNPKSPKKLQQVQPKPIFQATRGRGRTLNKNPTNKRQNKNDKTMMNPPIGPNGAVIQFQSNGTNQPSIILQQVANPNVMSAYVETLQQPHGSYIATITPQGDFKTTPTHYISQSGILPQTFQIQQTETGGLVAVPSGGIPVFLPQGGVGILPQNSLQSQGMTLSSQGNIQTTPILPQGAIQTQNGTTILPQGALQTQNGTTILPQGTSIQGLTQGSIQSQGTTLLPTNSLQSQNATIVPHNNINNTSQTILPQSVLQTQGNTLISQQPGTTIIPPGTILPQGLQFCNDQVLLGSTPTLEMVTDSSGCMYLTTPQPVYYGLETIVQNTVMSSQQFVSTAMQGVLAQNSSFSATTTQVFQASKIEPIVEVPTGYVVVNNVSQDNIIVSQPNSANSQTIISSQPLTNSNVTTLSSPAQLSKNSKNINGPNITIQPALDKQNLSAIQRQGTKTISIQPNQPIFSITPSQTGNSLALQSLPRNISLSQGKSGISLQPLQTNIIQSGTIPISVNNVQSNSNSDNIAVHLNQPLTSNQVLPGNSKVVTNFNHLNASSNMQVNSNSNRMEPNLIHQPSNNSQQIRSSISQQWKPNQTFVQTSADLNTKTSTFNVESNDNQIIIHKSSANSVNNTVLSANNVNSSRSFASNFGQPIFTETPMMTKGSQLNLSSVNSAGNSMNICNSSHNSIAQNNFTTPSSSINNSFLMTTSICQPIQSSNMNSQQINSSVNKDLNENSFSHLSNVQLSNSEDVSNKQSNLQMTCNVHRSLSASESSSESINNGNIIQIPSNMMNLSLQGGKIYQIPMSNNSMPHMVLNSNLNANNLQNQGSCSVQINSGNSNNSQNNSNLTNSQISLNNLDQLNTTNNFQNNNLVQVNCGSSQVNTLCGQHQIISSPSIQNQTQNQQMPNSNQIIVNNGTSISNNMQIVNNQNHQIFTNSNMNNHNLCNNNRLINTDASADNHSFNRNANESLSPALNEKLQMQIGNSSCVHQLSASNNLINNQMQLNTTANNNQTQENLSRDISGNNSHSQYQINGNQMFLISNSSNNVTSGTNILHGMSNSFSQQVQSNNSDVHNNRQNSEMSGNIHDIGNQMNLKLAPNKSNMFGSKITTTIGNSNIDISMIPAELPDSSKLNMNKPSTPVLSISNGNQIGYIQMNANNQMLGLNEQNRIPLPNNLNSQIQAIQRTQNTPILTIGQNDLSSQNSASSIITSKGNDMPSLTISVNSNVISGSHMPSLSKQINLPQHNMVNNCINPSVNFSLSGPNLQTLQNIHSKNSNNTISLPAQNVNNTISLPIQNSSSISLPKAPPHQTGIPTNVVNPIPQYMRPMNRVLPIHRDAQSTKAPRIPKIKIEPPKQSPHSHDMPDLNPKDDEIISNDVNKIISDSKTKTETEQSNKIVNPVPTVNIPPETSIQNNVTLNNIERVELQTADPVNKDKVTNISVDDNRKSVKQKENISENIMKSSLQKIDIMKISKENSISNLKNHLSSQRKVQVRNKSGLENISNVKLAKLPSSLNKIPKDNGPKLIYEISSEDGFNYTSPSLSELWNKVLDAVQTARKQHGLPLLKFSLSQNITAAHVLGLHNNALKYLLEQLPGAGRCTKYKTKHGKSMQPNWDNDVGLYESFRESPWGAARVGPAIRKSSADMFSWLASPYRDPPPSINISQDDHISRRLTSTTLPIAMRFRHLKETSKQTVGVYRSHIHGRGLFCKRDIEAGEMVIEYAGEVIRAALADQRERRYEAARGSRGVTGCYMFRVDDHLVVDATMKGNAARFINHSCDPNCYSKVVDILGHKHILILALRRIYQGEELTYDYKFPFEEVKIPCTCGAKKCRKYLN